MPVAAAGQDVGEQVAKYGSLNKVPAEAVGNTRNDMYLTSEAIRFLMKDKENDLNKEEVAVLRDYKASLDNATKFIPTWVKIAVAIALGLGTMIGWKRIVITVGEKIGKSHLTYAQGASAELVAAGPPEWRRIGQLSRAYVERVHDVERIADALVELYESLPR